jgi:hypothetical protein
MSQAFTRILDNQSNKLLANLPSNDILKMDVSVPLTQPVPSINHVQSVPLLSPQVGEGIHETKIIKLLGYEFTAYTLILVVVLIICVGYFLYKYFFTKTDLVVYKKNNKKEAKKNKIINKEEFSNSSKSQNSSNNSNASHSSSAQTLDM